MRRLPPLKQQQTSKVSPEGGAHHLIVVTQGESSLQATPLRHFRRDFANGLHDMIRVDLRSA